MTSVVVTRVAEDSVRVIKRSSCLGHQHPVTRAPVKQRNEHSNKMLPRTNRHPPILKQ